RGDVLDEPFAPHYLDVLKRDRGLDRMSAEREAVREGSAALEEGRRDRVGRDDGADRGVGGGEPLRGRDEVRTDVVALRAEPGAEPSETRDHLVGTEQDAVAIANRTDSFEVPGWSRKRPARVLDGLHEHDRDRL